jgi:hypothetical protein
MTRTRSDMPPADATAPPALAPPDASPVSRVEFMATILDRLPLPGGDIVCACPGR